MGLTFRFLGKPSSPSARNQPFSAPSRVQPIAERAKDPAQGVLVVGCGRMGCAIAGELARRGCFVTMYDETEFKGQNAKHNLQATLLDHVKQGQMVSTEECSSLMSRIKVAETLEAAAASSAVVFEAIVDDLQMKRRIFRKILLSGSTAIVTTNTINLALDAINAPFNDGTELQVWGCRFLLPVWFIDDVEVNADAKPAANLKAFLSTLNFKMHRFNGTRMRLKPEAHQRYAGERHAAVMRGRHSEDHVDRMRENMGQERPDGAENSDIIDATQTCAVCLDAPCSALIKPCGHTSTCMDCARALQPPLCVTCRSPIQNIIPWRDL